MHADITPESVERVARRVVELLRAEPKQSRSVQSRRLKCSRTTLWRREKRAELKRLVNSTL